jgi:hypothetical protein
VEMTPGSGSRMLVVRPDDIQRRRLKRGMKGEQLRYREAWEWTKPRARYGRKRTEEENPCLAVSVFPILHTARLWPPSRWPVRMVAMTRRRVLCECCSPLPTGEKEDEKSGNRDYSRDG